LKYLLFTVTTLLTLHASADVMNLNELMPVRLEDASPTNEKKTQIQFSGHFEEENNDDVLEYRPDLRYGVNRKIQLESIATFYSGGDERGSGNIQFGCLRDAGAGYELGASLGVGLNRAAPNWTSSLGLQKEF